MTKRTFPDKSLDPETGLYYYGARYLGDTRIVTKLNSGENPTYQEESRKQYYYHSDHLGSASLISDYKGDEYQRLEYTPYGETWVEKTQNTGLEFLPYKFTAKELDEETGLYYYGARYLDPKYSMWLSTDPALGEYMAGSDAGLGGVYNSVNLNLYHYANNNPVKYTDPTGRNAKYSINDEEQTVTITISITIYGDDASDEVAMRYAEGINGAWGGERKTTIDGKEYKVNIKASVTVGEEPVNPSPNDAMNYIKVDKSIETSKVEHNRYTGTWRTNGRKGKTLINDNPAPHEAGHLLGLGDRYSNIEKDGKIISVPHEGWEGNIMASGPNVAGGPKVDQRNINEIMQNIQKIRNNSEPKNSKNGVLKAR